MEAGGLLATLADQERAGVQGAHKVVGVENRVQRLHLEDVTIHDILQQRQSFLYQPQRWECALTLLKQHTTIIRRYSEIKDDKNEHMFTVNIYESLI